MNNVERMIAGLRCCAESNDECAAEKCPLFEMCKATEALPMGMAAEMMQALMQQRDDAENDRVALETKLSELLSHVTGGRFSKSAYSIEDMKRFVDDCQQSECERCEELAQVKRERDAAVEDLNTICVGLSACFRCMHYHDDDGPSNDCMDCNNGCNWEWRGVQEVAKDEE